MLHSVILHEKRFLCRGALPFYYRSLAAGLNVGKPQAIFSRARLLPTKLTPDADEKKSLCEHSLSRGREKKMWLLISELKNKWSRQVSLPCRCELKQRGPPRIKQAMIAPGKTKQAACREHRESPMKWPTPCLQLSLSLCCCFYGAWMAA